MTNGDIADEAPLVPRTVGERLRHARETQGLDLGEVAQRTRIPQRHLEAIERGDYNALPATTYAMGFAKAYARAINLDSGDLARDLRQELDRSYSRPVREMYVASDPRRVPTPGVVLGGLAVALLLLVAVAVFYGTNWFRTDDAPPPAPVVADAPPSPPNDAAASVEGGQVTLTATDEVWVRIYDRTGRTLLLKTMAAGEQFDIPVDADNPMINTGRADQIEVRVNGSVVPPLGDGRRAIQDVAVGAAALQARGSTESPAPATGAPS